MHVSNMKNSRGKAIPNQSIINDDEGNRFFQSYRTVIVKVASSGQVYLDESAWGYSRTTSKYRNLFLNETSKEVERKVKDGTYKLVDLN